MSDYRELDAWKVGHATRLAIYRATATYPREERIALVDQTRRAASSITSNIAEGAGRDSRQEYARFLAYALGSVNEVEDHLLLAHDLGYLSIDAWTRLGEDLARVRSMLIRLRQFMKRRPPGPDLSMKQRETGNG